MAVKNSTVLDQIWLAGTNDYQQRIPRASQAGVTKVAKALFKPMNRMYYNEFVSSLVNRIGLTVVHQLDWENPLAQFKREQLTMGSTIQEIANRLVKAHGYDLEDGNLFDVNRPDSEVAYHTVNVQDRYDISINEVELRKGFTTPDGLATYIASVLSIPQTSSANDEYRIMLQLFREYADDGRGFFKVHVDKVSDEVTAKNMLAKIRAYTGRLSFLSALYNKAGIPVFAKPENLVLFTTPEVASEIDVHALAGAFNTSFAEVQSRVVLVDEFPMTGTEAILASKDLFVSADYIFQNESFYNPKTLNTNYYLHRWGVYSMSPFMPAIEFTTGESTDPATITSTPEKLSIEVRDQFGDVKTEGDPYLKDNKFVVITNLDGKVDPENDDVFVKPDSVLFEITAPEGVKLNSRTYIDRTGTLRVQKGLPVDTVLTISAISTYKNPSDITEEEFEASTEFTIK